MAYSVYVRIDVKLKRGGSTTSTNYNTTVRCSSKTDFGVQEGAREYVLGKHPGWTITELKVKLK